MFCFSKFCRICLSKNNTLVNVDHLALNKLQFISPTLVERQCNCMFLWICDKCQAQLNSAYNFLQHCLTTASLLEGYYLQLTTTNTEQNLCNNLKEESIENLIKKEEYLEDLSEIQDKQYFSESSITIVKHELPPVDLKTEIKFNNSAFESIYLKEFDFGFIANDETNKNGLDFTECSPNLTKNIPENRVAETNDQTNITSCNDDCNDVIENSNSLKLLATNRRIRNEKRQNFTNLNRNKSAVNKEKPYECNICKKKFSHSGNLKRHKRTHTGERPYRCSMCPKKFNDSYHLKGHERAHTGELPYKCNMCPKKFNHSGDLKKHEKLHTGERPYKCNICSKKFSQKSNLKVHEKLHSGELPYKCYMCPKKFNRSGNLRSHEMIHSGERPYQCNMSKKFIISGNLKKHEKAHNYVLCEKF